MFRQLVQRLLPVALLSSCLNWRGLSADWDGGQLDGGFQPHPRLTALARGSALDLGAYNCDRRVDPALDCHRLTRSALVYDPGKHRMLLFAGGPTSTARTDVDVFDLNDLSWSSLYPSMTCAEIADAGNDIDSRGFFRRTGHPLARGTSDMMVVAKVQGEWNLLLLGGEILNDACNRVGLGMQSAVSRLPLATTPATWVHGMAGRLPWGSYAGVEVDPANGRLVIFGQGANASPVGLWIYDLQAGEVINSVSNLTNLSGTGTLIHRPTSDTFLSFFRGGPSATLLELSVNRQNYSKSDAGLRPMTGELPSELYGLAYDPLHDTVAGALSAGRWFTLNLDTFSWSAQSVSSQSDVGADLGSLAAMALAFDPVNRVFIFLARGNNGLHTWAYRP